MNKVMIIEDDLNCIQDLKAILSLPDSKIVSITKSESASITMYQRLRPNIVLIDIILDGKQYGLKIAKHLKEINPNVKIIFLTQYSSNEMIQLAVELKADGYIMKPIRKDEMIATIKLATIKKDQALSTTEPLIQLKDGYSFNAKKSILIYDQQEVQLSKRERSLLHLLCQNLNHYVSLEQITYHVWGENRSISTIRSLIHRIRNKLKSNIILNSSSYGYRILT